MNFETMHAYLILQKIYTDSRAWQWYFIHSCIQSWITLIRLQICRFPGIANVIELSVLVVQTRTLGSALILHIQLIWQSFSSHWKEQKNSVVIRKFTLKWNWKLPLKGTTCTPKSSSFDLQWRVSSDRSCK